MPSRLTVRGAYEHNLRHVDLDVPHEAIVAFTGVSGSGKSSLALDTIYREAERRYLESFSAHTRRLLARLGRPKVESIEGLRPAMALAQRRSKPGARSTVGTLSDAWSTLRLLFAKCGTMRCHACGGELAEIDPAELTARLGARFEGRPLRVLAPVVDDHTGEHRAAIERLAALGCSDVWIDGTTAASTAPPGLTKNDRHSIAGIVGDAGFWPITDLTDFGQRIERGLRIADGRLWIETADEVIARFSSRDACVHCDAPTTPLGPRLFSFNSPFGACPECAGLGVADAVDPALLVADPSRTLREGALVPTTKSGYIVYSQVTVDVLDTVCRAHGFDVDTAWCELREDQQAVVLHGSDRIEVPFGKHPLESRLKWKGITAKPRETGYYQGIVPTIAAILARSRNQNALRFARTVPCSSCAGTRLRVEARSVWLEGKSIAECASLELRELRRFLGTVGDGAAGDANHRPVAAPILSSLDARLALLEELGLGYLSLDRSGDSLSGGEAQRVRLASQVAAQLTGMLYVLDEPSAGLHASDRGKLYLLLARLRDAGGSVFVVEHDPASALRADWLVDVGPGAGAQGGRVLFAGPPAELLAKHRSSGSWHSASTDEDSTSDTSPRQATGAALRIRGARTNNLRDIAADFELGLLHAVTGVSGAGKSSLVHGVLVPAVRTYLDNRDAAAHHPPRDWDTIEGLDAIDKLIAVDADPIGRTPRSNPATYTGLFDPIRALFAAESAAKHAGLGKGHFSFNGKAGRCAACEGAGHELIPMHGLAPQITPCPVCDGRRFRDEVLAIHWRSRSIREVLDLTIAEAREVFDGQTKITRVLDALLEVGVGYLTLGQPAPTLSGGEAQRVKLAKELARPARGHTLYVLDEPSAGLAVRDVDVLTRALLRLVDAGHTVVVVDHHPRLIQRADRVLDLGPGAGRDGGRVVARGTPTELAELRAPQDSATSTMLAQASLALEARPIARRQDRPTATTFLGVCTHNLRSIDATFPSGKLTVVTGVSGSGKSSLVSDTLYAEGRRRFLEGLPSHVRRRLPGPSEGAFESVRGLAASLAVDQRARRYGARSTVGTITEILEDLRLLFARAGDDKTLDSARAFSFHDPAGACATCSGRGAMRRCDATALLHDPKVSIAAGALAGSRAGRFYAEPLGQHVAILTAVGRALGIDFGVPWSKLDKHARAIAMAGTGDQRTFDVVWQFERNGRIGEQELTAAWLGFCGYIDEEYARKSPDGRGRDLEPLLHELDCATCGGSRLAERPRNAKFDGQTLPQWCALPIHEFLRQLRRVEDPVLTETGLGERIERRATRMLDLGVGYLSLDRRARTLSGGEAQRARLVGQLLSGLDGLTYVLDEPTLGLHPADVVRLIASIRELVRPDNRVVVVEHDPRVIAAADHVLELGPQAGKAGGRLIYEGPAEALASADTPTGRALAKASGRRVLNSGRARAGRSSTGQSSTGRRIEFEGVRANNLMGFDLSLPLGQLIAVTGVSGSGKTSLVFDVIGPSVTRHVPVACNGIAGTEHLDSVVTLTYGSLGRSPNVTPATYLGLLASLQRAFSASTSAAELGLRPAAFSLSQKGGRCEACKGDGRVREELDVLGAVWMPCETCRGHRFGPDVRACTVGGLDIATLLGSEITTVLGWAEHHAPQLRDPLCRLVDVGLGYLQLGQTADTLSGGESQRLRLVQELGRTKPGDTRLYLLDEPSTGLHPADVEWLLLALRRLVTDGHTVVVVEHDLDVIAAADLVLDLGPGAGEDGGRLLAQCAPAELVEVTESLTGTVLGDQLELGFTDPIDRQQS